MEYCYNFKTLPVKMFGEKGKINVRFSQSDPSYLL